MSAPEMPSYLKEGTLTNGMENEFCVKRVLFLVHPGTSFVTLDMAIHVFVYSVI